MTQEAARDKETTRRAALAGAGLAGLAASLAACGASGGGSPAAMSSTPSRASRSAQPGGSGTMALAATSEIPEGGGKIFAAEKVVVTQPASGQFKAFSAICTHQQCLVDRVANGTIDCPCHGSEFSVTDGRVVSGPAPSPLPARPIKVADGKITLA